MRSDQTRKAKGFAAPNHYNMSLTPPPPSLKVLCSGFVMPIHITLDFLDIWNACAVVIIEGLEGQPKFQC